MRSPESKRWLLRELARSEEMDAVRSKKKRRRRRHGRTDMIPAEVLQKGSLETGRGNGAGSCLHHESGSETDGY